MKKIIFYTLFYFAFALNLYSQNVETLAGSSQGYLNSSNLLSQFYSPFDLCVNSQGTVYVSDQNNTIRKIEVSGVVTTLAGNLNPGYTDGPGNLAQFYTPNSICVDSNGIIYVADYNNNKIRKITPDGIVSTLAGSTQGYSDGIGTNAQFFLPQGVCVDLNGNVYVADAQNHMIRKITPEGIVTTLAGSTQGYLDGNGLNAQFNFPTRLCVDYSGFVYVTDTLNNKIRKISPSGFVTTLAGSTLGFNDGISSLAQFFYPMGICVDGIGNVYVADGNNNKIRKVSPNGFVSTYAGTSQGYLDGEASYSQFYSPTGVCIDSNGTLYVTDRNNYKIRKISSTLNVYENNDLFESIKIYPNPVNGILHIETDNLNLYNQLFITDLLGKEILSQKFEKARTTINTGDFEKGIYFVTLSNGNQKITKKIIIN